MIGDYILKIGSMRTNEKIPNDKRILQPIIRQELEPGEMKNYEYNFIEVQNAVDKDWHEGMTEKQIEDILYEVYADMRSRGIIWTDIKKDNVGRLLKPNKINYTYTDIDGEEKDLRPTEEATGIIGEIQESDVLPAGEYVVLDTDFITRKDVITTDMYRKFETRYNLEKKQNQSKNEEAR